MNYALDKAFIKQEVVLIASKKDFFCILRFIGQRSLQLRTYLVKSIESNLKFCKLKAFFTNHRRAIRIYLGRNRIKQTRASVFITIKQEQYISLRKHSWVKQSSGMMVNKHVCNTINIDCGYYLYLR